MVLAVVIDIGQIPPLESAIPTDRNAIIESDASRLVNEDAQSHAAAFLLVLQVDKFITEIIEDRFNQCFNLCLDLFSHHFFQNKKSEPRSSLFR